MSTKPERVLDGDTAGLTQTWIGTAPVGTNFLLFELNRSTVVSSIEIWSHCKYVCPKVVEVELGESASALSSLGRTDIQKGGWAEGWAECVDQAKLPTGSVRFIKLWLREGGIDGDGYGYCAVKQVRIRTLSHAVGPAARAAAASNPKEEAEATVKESKCKGFLKLS